MGLRPFIAKIGLYVSSTERLLSVDQHLYYDDTSFRRTDTKDLRAYTVHLKTKCIIKKYCTILPKTL